MTSKQHQMVTRQQFESLTKEQLIDQLIDTKNGIQDQLISLNSRLEEYMPTIEKLTSDVQISKNTSKLLNERIIQLEKNHLNLSQYTRKHMIELNPVPLSISDGELETQVCKAISLCGVPVDKNNFQAIHRLKNPNKVILQFNDRRQKEDVISKRSNLKDKSDELRKLNFGDELFINESLSPGNQNLFYKCRQLKAKKIISKSSKSKIE